MPPKIDPVEAWYAAGNSLIGRILLFFSAGWVGLVLGRIANYFTEWNDFLTPQYALKGIFSGAGYGLTGELLAFVFWPLSIFFLAKIPVLLVLALIVMGASFFALVFTEEPAPVWWLVIVATISVCPLVGDIDSDFSFPPWVVLGFFWSGIGFAGWWALRSYHPELIEKVGDLVQGRDSEAPAQTTPHRKAPPNTWGKPVKGWDGEESEPASNHDDDDDSVS